MADTPGQPLDVGAGLSDDGARPIEVRFSTCGGGRNVEHLTRDQAWDLVGALQLTLARTMPGLPFVVHTAIDPGTR